MHRAVHLALLALLGPAPLRAQDAAPRRYDVDAARSYIVAVTHRAGLFSFLGHEHAILAADHDVTLCVDPLAPSSASLRVSVPVRALVIDSDSARRLARLGGGPGADTRAEIARKLLDEKRLHADVYPAITFASVSVEQRRAERWQVAGQLTIRGVTRDVSLPAEVTFAPDGAALLDGTLRISLRAYGVTAETVAGVVRVADEVDLRVHLVAAPTATACAERAAAPR